jgi:hypothetical protein
MLIFVIQNIAMRKKIITSCLICCSFLAVAQDEKTPEKKSYGMGSLEFINNSVYLGRKDSGTTAYLNPSLGYYHKSGVFISGTASYLFRSGANRFDVFNLDGGYDFSRGNFNSEIAAEKSFYNSNSTNVKSEVKGSISASAGYDFGFIETSLQPGISFGTRNDYFLSGGLDHTFSLVDSSLEITPSFLLNGSTRNFYGSYYGHRKFKKTNGPGSTTTASVLDASKFKIMDYEFSLPFSYTIKKITFGFTPSYAIPTNAAVVTVVIKPPVGPTITRTNTEKLENTFYFSLDASIKF